MWRTIGSSEEKVRAFWMEYKRDTVVVNTGCYYDRWKITFFQLIYVIIKRIYANLEVVF